MFLFYPNPEEEVSQRVGQAALFAQREGKDRKKHMDGPVPFASPANSIYS
jgi:hypothetical protein